MSITTHAMCLHSSTMFLHSLQSGEVMSTYMKVLVRIASTLIVGCSLHTAQSEEAYSAFARYRTHRYSHYVRIHRVRHHDRTTIYNPDRTLVNPDTSVVKATWPYVEAEVIYPYATGTSILNAWTGRVPVISDSRCMNLSAGWYLRDRVSQIEGSIEAK